MAQYPTYIHTKYTHNTIWTFEILKSELNISPTTIYDKTWISNHWYKNQQSHESSRSWEIENSI